MLGYIIVKFTDEGQLVKGQTPGNRWIYSIDEGDETKYYVFNVPEGQEPVVGDYLLDGEYKKGIDANSNS